MWRSLATEPTLTSQILEQLLEKVNRDVPYKESKGFPLLGSGSERVATPLPLAVSVVPPRCRPGPAEDAVPRTDTCDAFFHSRGSGERGKGGGIVPGADSGNNASLCNAY